jgi:hypothetical protein
MRRKRTGKPVTARDEQLVALANAQLREAQRNLRAAGARRAAAAVARARKSAQGALNHVHRMAFANGEVLPPSMPKLPELISPAVIRVHVDGGTVQDVDGIPAGVVVKVIDCDGDGAEDWEDKLSADDAEFVGQKRAKVGIYSGNSGAPQQLYRVRRDDGLWLRDTSVSPDIAFGEEQIAIRIDAALAEQLGYNRGRYALIGGEVAPPRSCLGVLNTYDCPRCKTHWTDEWDCGCDDDCPQCGLTCSPTSSEDAADAAVAAS